METQENSGRNSSNISTEDILKALESYPGERTKLSSSVDHSKALNRDSGLSCSESCSSFISDPLSVNGDGQSVLSDSEHLSDFTSDNFSVISDPLGVCSTSDDGEGDNDIHFFETKPWDEKQSLESEWKLLFNSENYFSELPHYALSGKLKHSKYRSIAWKVFLDCLPEDQDQWIMKTKQLRYEYKTFKQKSLIDPSKSQEDVESLQVLHPLSLDESSPWKQYFKDNELKAVITQDLDRLYPEIEFFNSSNIKETMLHLLFCYAKKNEGLGYKQGMHELLAPIVYVLECDSKSHKYTDGMNETIRYLLDPSYIEHDAFAMFCQLMEVTETWYQLYNIPLEITTNNKFLSNSEPFAAPVTAPPTAIVKKLNKIQDHLLRKHDTDLWFHLKEMNIEPQVYGLRWVRLLFSREFPFQDVLVIWDALFADGRHLDLVEYIYIVMLQTIRSKLLASNYTTCMSYLMKFPHIHEDVHVIVKRAMNLRASKKSRPLPRPMQSKPSGQTAKPVSEKKTADHLDLFSGKPQKKKSSPRRPHSALANFTKRYTSQLTEPKMSGLPSSKHSQEENAPTTKELINKPYKEAISDSLTSPITRDRTDSTGSAAGRTMKSLGSELKTKLTRRSRQSVEELEKDHQRLQVQVSELNSEIDRMQGLYLYCGRKLDSYIGLLQEEVTRDALADRDIVYLSLAGLKQVRDLLKGTLSYRGSSMETEKDFFDIDKGIATRLQISSPNVRPDEIPPEDKHQTETTSQEHTPESSSLLDGNKEISSPKIEAQQDDQVQTISKECLPESRSINTALGDQVFSKESKMSTPVRCTVNCLDSYIEEHFSTPNECLIEVPCSTASVMPQSNSSNLSKDFRQDASNLSTPDETFDKEFVFVNKDGTAVRTAEEVSPRLTQTHPLQTEDDNNQNDL